MTYSFNDFTGANLSGKTDMFDIEIRSSCFSQEKPDSNIFPQNMSGVTFINCNLDNCIIPAGNAVIDCSQRRFKAQDDGFDWLIDKNNNPIERLG